VGGAVRFPGPISPPPGLGRTALPPPRCIAIDVDGTLFHGAQVNERLVSWARGRHAAGYQLVVWSMRGTAYAQRAVESAGLADIVLAAISKPGYLVDNEGWKWARGTVVVRDLGGANMD